MLSPTDCIVKDFNKSWYKKWAKEIGYPAAKHPKFWEGAFIAQALEARGCLQKNKKGLGMGVGQEQLAALFASKGAYITATDQDPESDQAQKWDNGQLSKGLSSLYYPNIISKELFDQNVTYKAYDMNRDEPSFRNMYDFIWHNCVIGHLGSMKNSTLQLERSADYLVDDGWLIFTTELNVGSFDDTVFKDSDTIIWRLKDLLGLFEALAEKGLRADRLEIRMGDNNADARVNTVFNHNTYENVHAELLDDPKHSEIKIPFGGFVLTQISLCFKKTGTKLAQKAMKEHRADYEKNKANILRHLKINKDLAMYHFAPKDNELQEAQLTPLRTEINIIMHPGEEKVVDLSYINNSNLYLFDLNILKPNVHPPLVLATMDPINRESEFCAPSWSSDNRPCFSFSEQANGTQIGLWSYHIVKPSNDFMYKLPLCAPYKEGKYTESFVLVFEGRSVAMSSRVQVNIEVIEAANQQHKSKESADYSSLMERLSDIERRLKNIEGHLMIKKMKSVFEALSSFRYIGFRYKPEVSPHYLTSQIGLPVEFKNRRVSELRVNNVKDIGNYDWIISPTYTPTKKPVEQIKEYNSSGGWYYKHISNRTLFEGYINAASVTHLH